MPITFTVNRIPWDTAPAVNQVCTLAHKKGTDTNWTIDSNTVQVQVDGNLVTPYPITGLDFATQYNVRAVNNCGAAEKIITFTTPNNPCPAPTDIIGTTSIG